MDRADDADERRYRSIECADRYCYSRLDRGFVLLKSMFFVFDHRNMSNDIESYLHNHVILSYLTYFDIHLLF